MNFFKLFLLVSPISIFSQELLKCNNNINYILKNTENQYISLKIEGEVEQLKNPQVFVLNQKTILQLLLNDSKNYTEQGNDDLTIMATYVLSEGKYFSSIFKKKIDLAIFPEELNEGKKAIYWYFSLPESATADSKIKALKSVFITSVNGTVITTIGTTQFENQSIEEIRKQLVDFSKNIKIDNKKEICN